MLDQEATLVLEEAVETVEKELAANELLFLGSQLRDLRCGTTNTRWEIKSMLEEDQIPCTHTATLSCAQP